MKPGFPENHVYSDVLVLQSWVIANKPRRQ
jgi:hypothetical protein